MIKGIIFDFDNTLYDYDSINITALQITFECMSNQFNINIDIINNLYKKINKTIKLSNNSCNKFNKYIYIKQIFEILNVPIKFIYDYVNIYNDNFYKLFKLYDGVAELFIFLKSKNIKIGILSNNVFLQQLDKLKYANILEYIDFIQTSDECGEEKPNKKCFTLIQSKINIPFEKIAFIGDNYEHDILPVIELGMLPFWFNSSFNLINIYNNIIQFGNFYELNIFFKNYYQTINQFIFLSKYFGQSCLNVQGPGGNISVKTDNILFIKSSGCTLGNSNYDEGYCLVDNVKCIELVKTKVNTINSIKLFGIRNPSIETFFHSFMKPYTVHLHFTLSNIFLCSNSDLTRILKDFYYDYSIVEYYTPGIDLACEIYNIYSNECDIYFLKNHGIIITANTIEKIIEYYEYIYKFFNNKLNNIYDNEFICFKLNQIYNTNSKNVIIKHIKCPINILKNIIVCFPDLAVFIQKIIEIDTLAALQHNFNYHDIIIFNNEVYLVTENVSKMYALIEILDSYMILYNSNNTYTKLVSINNVSHIQNMPEELYRKM